MTRTRWSSRIAALPLMLALVACSPTALADWTRLPAGESKAPSPTPVQSPLPATVSATPVPAVSGASPTAFIPESATATATPFAVGQELTIPYLRQLVIDGSPITFEQDLTSTFYYERHIVSYQSEGNKIYGLLTIPHGEVPDGGFKAIVFNHGYIPPSLYQTTERYVAYVDYLARSGFVVFKIDLRGHGQSEGEPSGAYYSPGYTIDAIAALKSLQTLDFVDPDGIGMWGHSMAGNLTLRAMLIEPAIRAGVIWSGAVYSYDDLASYGIDDNTYRPPATEGVSESRQRRQQIFDTYGRPSTQVAYWRAVSLTENIDFLTSPLQIHHALDDTVVSVRYSEDLAAVLLANGKDYEFYTYEGGGHNLISPWFDQAMLRTVEFFRRHL